MGIGGSVHDFSACLVEDGRVVMAVEDERITRQKYGMGTVSALGFAARYCLRHAGISPGDVDMYVANDAVMHTAYSLAGDRVHLMNHHLAHAASAFFGSPFEEAAILVIDNEGSKVRGQTTQGRLSETISYAVGRKNRLETLGRVVGSKWFIVQTPCSHPTCIQRGPEIHDWLTSEYTRQHGHPPGELIRPLCLADKIIDHSLGGLYLAVTRMVGLGCMDAGKTMGLAAYGRDTLYPSLRSFVTLAADGGVQIDVPQSFVAEFAAAGNGKSGDDLFQLRADLAWAAQRVLEDVLFHCVDHLHHLTGLRNLCIAGGCGLNCQANGKLLERGPFEQVFVPPASADSGTALGAALYGYYVLHDARRTDPSAFCLRHTFLGPVPPPEAVEAALLSCEGIRWRYVENIYRLTAKAIAAGAIVGWYRGRSEHGPRALGHRSIVADPRRPEMKDILNDRVKHREPFRPFAPAVLAEHAAEYFVIDRPSPFMLFAVPARRPHEIPAVVHVDGTARVQTVDRETNPEFYDLIAAFRDITGVPVILNTSFNLKGEPIVESPRDALRSFLASEMDALALGDAWVTKDARPLGAGQLAEKRG
jgi:carbamoyltransferase